MPITALLIACLRLLLALPGVAEARLAPVPPAQYSAEQQQASAEFEAARQQPLFGPFEPLMHSPALLTRARAMGDYIRGQSAVPPPLRELLILMTAHAWNQPYEWGVHAPIALEAGLRPQIVDAIAAGRRPPAMAADEAIAYNVARELLTTHQLSDATADAAIARFGGQGLVDMTGTLGYYTFLAMQLNVAQVPLPAE